MELRLAENIARFRKSRGYTQEELAKRLSISSQAVSKWENAQSLPDISLLPALAGLLETDIDTLMGYIPKKKAVTPYEERYKIEEYYWGTMPGEMCLELLRRCYPTRPLRLLEVGCGEGKDAVFFARNGYQVTAFDVTESGIEKAKRLADIHQVEVNFFRADLHDYRLDEEFDVIYSSGVFHHILPELRREIMENYIAHTAPGCLQKAFQSAFQWTPDCFPGQKTAAAAKTHSPVFHAEFVHHLQNWPETVSFPEG